MTPKNEMSHLSDNVHFRYIIGILIGIIVILSSVAVGNSSKLFDYVNAGVALTSLTLAIFAIYMTAKSGEKSEQNTSDLRGIIVTNRDVSDRLVQVTESAHKNLENLNRNIGEFSQKLENYNSESTSFKEIFQNSIVNSVENSEKVVSRPSIDIVELTEAQIGFFILSCSTSGLLFIWLSINMTKNHGELNISDIQKVHRSFSPDYAHGIIVASASSRVIDVEWTDRIVKATSIYENLLLRIENELAKRIADAESKKLQDFIVEVFDATKDFSRISAASESAKRE